MTEFRTLLSNFVKKNQTNGLLKNDGTVDTTNYLSTHQDITGKEDSSNKVASWSSTTTDAHYPSEKLVKSSLDNKVDKVSGKGLSTNDYDNTAKNKVDNLHTVATSGSYNDLTNKPTIPTVTSTIENGNTNAITSDAVYDALALKADSSGLATVATSGSYNDLADKPSIPDSTSDLTNDSGFLTSSDISGKQDKSNLVTSWSATTSDVKYPSEKLTKSALDNKVDKVSGKGLSTNDFTDSYKNTIDGLSDVASSGSYTDLTNKPTIPDSTSDLTNDSGFITSAAITGKEDSSNKVASISSSSTDTEYPSAKCVYDGIREFINTIYPVGSIYISANEVSPTTLFGGTWVRIQDRFLLGASDTYANESTGGEAPHTLTTNEMPSHTHTQNSHTHTQNSHTHSPTGSRRYIAVANGDNWGYTSKMKIGTGSSGTAYYYPHSDNNNDGITEQNATTSATPTINGQIATNQNTGGGQAHNNMPPYFSVGIWKKISNNTPFFIDKGVRDSSNIFNFGDIVQIESSNSASKSQMYNASNGIDAYKFNSTGTGTKFFPITALNGKSRIRLVMELYVPSSSVINTVFGFGVATTQNDAVVCNFSRSATVHTDYFNNGTFENTINLISNVPNDEWYYCEMIVDNDIVTMNVYNNDNVTVIFTDTTTLSEYSNSYSTLANRRYGITIGYADGSIGYARYIEATEL